VRLAVGYPVAGGEVARQFCETVGEYHEHIEEVYFAAPGTPSGRSPACEDGEIWANLAGLRSLGVKFDLLLNANCYGARAASQELADDVCRTLDTARERCGVDTVTTTSPFVADGLRRNDPELELRASVNMRIGTVQAMEMFADLFDGFYVQRDFNRDLPRLAELRKWTHDRGKKLCILANSGCLAFCPGQTFHDNLVAHEPELQNTPGLRHELLACRRFLSDRNNWRAILAATWIRPEDIPQYEHLADVAKLATRMHHNPRIVIAAYARRRFRGNLLDLLEPGYGDQLRGARVDARALPADWFDRTTSCRRDCDTCGYCRDVLEGALVLPDGPFDGRE
jgi:collagenase-like PrtC family protease